MTLNPRYRGTSHTLSPLECRSMLQKPRSSREGSGLRPLQQRESQHPQTPLPPQPHSPQEHQQSGPPLPPPKKHHRQHGPQGLVPDAEHPLKKPQEKHRRRDEQPEENFRRPLVGGPKQKNAEQFPKNQAERSKPYGPRVIEHPEGDGKYHSPWVLPHHKDEDRGGHQPRHGGGYHTPWILPPQQPDHDRQSLKPKDQDDSKIPLRQQSDSSHRHPHGLRAPPPQKTRPITWLGAAFCAIFWIVIFLGGLIVLIVYLIYRPRKPIFEVSSVTLNAAYVDAGDLLNADISVLANFTNPNKKVTVDFNHVIVDLYYGSTLTATQYFESFSAPKISSRFANIHMVSSQVRLPLGDAVQLQNQMSRNGVFFDIKAVFKVTSNLGIFRYSYRLYGHCKVLVTAPPSGVLKGTRCTTKR